MEDRGADPFANVPGRGKSRRQPVRRRPETWKSIWRVGRQCRRTWKIEALTRSSTSQDMENRGDDPFADIPGHMTAPPQPKGAVARSSFPSIATATSLRRRSLLQATRADLRRGAPWPLRQKRLRRREQLQLSLRLRPFLLQPLAKPVPRDRETPAALRVDPTPPDLADGGKARRRRRHTGPLASRS